jgi:hypothetical protein
MNILGKLRENSKVILGVGEDGSTSFYETADK